MNVTDQHVESMAKLSRLNSIVLSRTGISDGAAERLPDCIDALYVSNTSIGPNGIATIADRLSKLKILDISGLDVSGKLDSLAKLKNLEWLVLRESAISDSNAEVFLSHPKLVKLSVEGTEISRETIAKIKAANPTLVIEGANSKEKSGEETEPSGDATEPQPG